MVYIRCTYNLPLFNVDESHSKDNNSCCTSGAWFDKLEFFFLLFRITTPLTCLWVFRWHFFFSYLYIIDVFIALCVQYTILSTVCTTVDVFYIYIYASNTMSPYNNNFTHSKKVKKEIELSATQFHFYIFYLTEQNEVHTSPHYYSFSVSFPRSLP